MAKARVTSRNLFKKIVFSFKRKGARDEKKPPGQPKPPKPPNSPLEPLGLPPGPPGPGRRRKNTRYKVIKNKKGKTFKGST